MVTFFIEKRELECIDGKSLNLKSGHYPSWVASARIVLRFDDQPARVVPTVYTVGDRSKNALLLSDLSRQGFTGLPPSF